MNTFFICLFLLPIIWILFTWIGKKIAMKWLFGWRFIVINAEGEAWYIDVKPDAKVKPVGKNKDGA
ncbi:hypothetical protein [Shewanella xiamenensis]|uniref:Uncharacterized protein n=1 Tax=Shewanella xiamenensis TaxID=332186 RepID=A0AAE4TG56_9GAMM|nr:hypothetical protein [Shewanella xiamenensis]MDV5390791.1 hypothetical protein [Shewanella xiamenensis]